MACKLFALRSIVFQPVKTCVASSSYNVILTEKTITSPFNPTFNIWKNSVRHTSFFNKLPANQLWKSVLSVSNAGAKKGRGRGRGKRKVRDLNRGQVIGVGKINMLWPGLSAPIIRGRELLKQQRLPDDPERTAKLMAFRDSISGFRSLRLSPIERGFTGSRMPGRSIGPPDPIGEDNFHGFDTKVLEFRPILSMSGSLGRTRRFMAVCITGNGQGLAGFAIGKSKEGMAAIRKAKNRAGQKLMHFELCDGNGIFHDFYTQFGSTKIFVTKKGDGYGLVCHRVIKCMCEIIGITDLHAKVEGSTNVQHIIKAFLIGLLQQKTHQQLAEEKKLHLVEIRSEYENFPKLIASPSTKVREANEILKDETLDFKRYVMNDRVVLRRKKFPQFYMTMPHYEIYLKKLEKRRNHEKIRLQLIADRGELKSFLHDKYPESEFVAKTE
uniref:Small ribosomal subunit protein uS5m n=1 Tax=Endoclita signifer TaxID=1820040 RepID=A0A9E9EWY0_9NEOP|nr:ribosomal protein RIB [Endoclita signifer]